MKERRTNISAEQVHFVAGKTRKVSLGVAFVGVFTGILPFMVGGSIGWGLSALSDEVAKFRIRSLTHRQAETTVSQEQNSA